MQFGTEFALILPVINRSGFGLAAQINPVHLLQYGRVFTNAANAVAI